MLPLPPAQSGGFCFLGSRVLSSAVTSSSLYYSCFKDPKLRQVDYSPINLRWISLSRRVTRICVIHCSNPPVRLPAAPRARGLREVFVRNDSWCCQPQLSLSLRLSRSQTRPRLGSGSSVRRCSYTYYGAAAFGAISHQKKKERKRPKQLLTLVNGL